MHANSWTVWCQSVDGRLSQRRLEVMDDWKPDVIVSDIGMPGQDGYELMRCIRSLPAERGGHTPAAALTAFTGREDRSKALASGYQTHISKPLEPSTLVAVLARLAGRTAKRES